MTLDRSDRLLIAAAVASVLFAAVMLALWQAAEIVFHSPGFGPSAL